MKIKLSYLASLAFVLILVSCDRNVEDYSTEYSPELPSTPYSYMDADQIAYNEQLGIDVKAELENKQVTDAKAALGRVLFYDRQLSINNQVSCGSCHVQEKSFSDPVRFSEGFEGNVTTRNSMAIVNTVMLNDLFWDSRSADLENLVSQPIQNHLEMGMESMTTLANKVNKIDYYPSLFEAAYGNSTASKEKIIESMSSFLRSMVSFRSKYDMVERGMASFTESEARGEEIFFSDESACSNCHTGTNFSAPNGTTFSSTSAAFGQYYAPTKGTANIGLDAVYADKGFGNGRFKIPSLRNVAVTGPYMHDGRYATLEDVIGHYSNGSVDNPDLDSFMKDQLGNPKRINYTSEETEDLIAFLHTLTDENYLTDVRFSDPFVK